MYAEGLLVRAPVPRVEGKAILSDHRDMLRIYPRDRSAVRADPVGSGDWDVSYRATDSGGQAVYDLTLAQGVPFAWVETRNREWGVALPPSSTVETVRCPVGTCGSALLIRAPNTRYLIISSQVGTTVNGSDVRLAFSGNATFAVAVLAPNTDPALYLPFALRVVRGTRATFSVEGSRVLTTFTYPFETLVGVLPHQRTQLTVNVPALGVYSTTHGHVLLTRVRTFTTALPRPTVLPALPTSAALRTDSAFLTQLQADIRENRPLAGDIYGAAKDIGRKAHLLDMAEAVGDAALQREILAQVRGHLVDFCTADGPADTRYLAYDTKAGGIIALPVAFGSQNYNDHHFHYGYLIRAAAAVTRLDPSFRSQYGQCINLLMRDIANTNMTDGLFPRLRHFDVYGGHSWAGGLTTFADGNNQESTSEAMQAWYAIALYGRTTGQKSLEDLGTWLLAQEQQGTLTYWLNANPGAKTLPKTFAYPMISIFWSGKADYATFFDGSDGAIRGIQFFPVTPALFGVVNRDVTERIIAPTAATADAGGIWKSALQLALSIAPAGRDAAVQPGTTIDLVYSRSFVTYWQRMLQELGEPVQSLAPCGGSLFVRNGVSTAVIYRHAHEPAQCTALVQGKNRTFQNLVIGWNIR